MTNLSQNDLNIRTWLITQKVSELSAQYSQSLRLGRPCSLKERNSLLLLEGVLDLLKCYQIIGDNTGIIYQVFGSGGKASTIEIFINNISISGQVTCIDNTYLTDAINLYQSNYIATNDGDNIIITSSCSFSGKLSYNILDLGYSTVTVDGMTNNACEINSSCYTEQDLQTLLDKVSEEYDLNFKPVGYTYTT